MILLGYYLALTLLLGAYVAHAVRLAWPLYQAAVAELGLASAFQGRGLEATLALVLLVACSFGAKMAVSFVGRYFFDELHWQIAWGWR
jgi:hypothetical protein